jgi:hypothetical protein
MPSVDKRIIRERLQFCCHSSLPSLSEMKYSVCFPTTQLSNQLIWVQAERRCKHTEHTIMEIRPQAIIVVFELKFNNVFVINEILHKLWILINCFACPGQGLKYTYVSKFSGETISRDTKNEIAETIKMEIS